MPGQPEESSRCTAIQAALKSTLGTMELLETSSLSDLGSTSEHELLALLTAIDGRVNAMKM